MTDRAGATTRRAAVGLMALLIVVAGCGGKDDNAMQPTMDVRQAQYRIETHIKDTVAQFPPEARLTDPFKMDSLPCDFPDDGGPEGRVIVEHSYMVDGLPSESFPEVFDTAQRYWEQRGHRELVDEKHEPGRVTVYTDSDGFRLTLKTSADGNYLWIRSQSPCIWPSGLPPTDAE